MLPKERKRFFRCLAPFRTIFAVFSFLWLGCAPAAMAYVSVAPAALFLSDADKTGEIIVQNTSASQIEIVIDFRFGYPVSDSTGNIGLCLFEDISISEPCAVEWIHAYPKKFILYPHQSRTVRFVLRPPAGGLKDGEYWARPVVISRPHNDLNQSMQQASAINAHVSTAIETVLALSYRHGSVSTDAMLTTVNVKRDNDKLIVVPSAIREGNAAYIGYAVARLYDEHNNLVKVASREVAIYYSLRIRLELDIHDLPKGTYRAEVEFNTDRPDANGLVLKATPKVKELELSLV